MRSNNLKNAIAKAKREIENGSDIDNTIGKIGNEYCDSNEKEELKKSIYKWYNKIVEEIEKEF